MMVYVMERAMVGDVVKDQRELVKMIPQKRKEEV